MVRKAAGKQLQADPHAKKSTESKATAPPQHSHTLMSAWDTTLQTTQAAGWGGREEGKEAVAGIMAFNLADGQLFRSCLSDLAFPVGAEGRRLQYPPQPGSGSPACTCRARRQLQLDNSYVSREAERAAGAICRATLQWICSSGGFAKVRFKAPSFCSGLQTLFCCKSRTLSPTFMSSRSHTVICKATLPAKCKCCPDHTNNLQWWFLTVGILPLLNLVRKDEGPPSQAQKRIET